MEETIAIKRVEKTNSNMFDYSNSARDAANIVTEGDGYYFVDKDGVAQPANNPTEKATRHMARAYYLISCYEILCLCSCFVASFLGVYRKIPEVGNR